MQRFFEGPFDSSLDRDPNESRGKKVLITTTQISFRAGMGVIGLALVRVGD